MLCYAMLLVYVLWQESPFLPPWEQKKGNVALVSPSSISQSPIFPQPELLAEKEEKGKGKPPCKF